MTVQMEAAQRRQALAEHMAAIYQKHVEMAGSDLKPDDLAYWLMMIDIFEFYNAMTLRF